MTKKTMTSLAIAAFVAAGCGMPQDEQEAHVAATTPAPPESATSPADAFERVQHAISATEIDTPEWRLLVEAFELAKEWGGYYSTAKTAADVLLTLGKALGVINVADADRRFDELKAAFEIAVAGGSTSATGNDVTILRGKWRTAMLDLQQFEIDRKLGRTTEAAFRPVFRDTHDASTKNALVTLADFESDRPKYSFGSANETLERDPVLAGLASNVYDWRLVVPALMEGIAFRLQFIAFLDPSFRTDQSRRTELVTYRTALLRHYDKMAAGIRGGGMDGFSACRDQASGVTLGYNFNLHDLCSRVSERMPLFAVRQMIDVLSLYIEGIPDVPGSYVAISPWTAKGLCLTVTSNAGFAPGSAAYLENCASAKQEQKWVYNRTKGTIVNARTGLCLEPIGGWGEGQTSQGGTDALPLRVTSPGKGARVGVYTCEEFRENGLLVPIARQRWTWDLTTGVLQSGLGPYNWPTGERPAAGVTQLGSTLSAFLLSGSTVGTALRSNTDAGQKWGFHESRFAQLVDPNTGVSTRVIRFSPAATLEFGVDRWGFDFEATNQPNALGCQARCQGNAACRAYTFRANDIASGTCWLKSGVGNAVFTSGLVSGVVNAGLDVNMARNGWSYRALSATPEGCAGTCAQDATCTAFSHANGECRLMWLFVPDATPSAGSFAGFKIDGRIF